MSERHVAPDAGHHMAPDPDLPGVVALDKTGTLTHGGPAISEIAFAPEADGEKVLALAAALEQSSPHVVAKAIVLVSRVPLI